MIIVEKLISIAVKAVAKQFKLEKILKYVEEPNELDNKVENLNDRIAILESLAHPKRDFVKCDKCKQLIKEN